MVYIIGLVFLISIAAAKYDYADFNPKYRNFNSYFENLEDRDKSDNHDRYCKTGSKSHASRNYKRYYHEFCKDDYSLTYIQRTAYRRYNTIVVRYI
jgi:hypothetical protein